jgi:hypothetical protein
LGATYDGTGTNFALFSEVAEAVHLCLFAADGTETRMALCPRWTARFVAPRRGNRFPRFPSAGLLLTTGASAGRLDLTLRVAIGFHDHSFLH